MSARPDAMPDTTSGTADGRPVQLAVIVASTREGRRGRTIADWFTTTIAERPEVTVDVLDLADFDLPAHYTFIASEALTDLRERLANADAYVVVTPEYNHSFPASVKHAIDFAKDQWKRKAVGFVSYGGVSGGLRAVEQLRLVFAELHVHGVRDTVSFHGPWNGFGDDGQPRDRVAAEAAANLLVTEIAWLGRALRTAREADAAEAGQW